MASEGWLPHPGQADLSRQGEEISLTEDVLPSLLTRNSVLMQILINTVLVSSNKINLVIKLCVYLKHFSDEFIFIVLVCNGPLGMTIKTASILLQSLLLHYIGILLTFNYSHLYLLCKFFIFYCFCYCLSMYLDS